MRYITLVIVPGDGASSVQVADGTTLAQFAADHALNGRQLIVDGEGVQQVSGAALPSMVLPRFSLPAQ